MHWLAVAGLVPVLLAGSSAAPQGSTTPSYLTESEFLAVLDGDHPALREAAQELALVHAEGLARSAFASPQIHFAREDPSGPGGQTDWAVSWQLPDPRRRLDLASQDHAQRAAVARLDDDRRRLRFQMRAAYGGWALADARFERLEEHLRRVEALTRREHERARRGEASGLDSHRLELAAADLRVRRTLAEQARIEARAQIRVWYPDLPTEARPVLALPEPPNAAADDTVDPPRIRAARAELEAQALARRAAQSLLRSPEVSAGWLREGSGEAANDGVSLGLSWTLPLGGERRARQATAEAHWSRSQARLDSALRQVEAQRRAARDAFELLASSHQDALSLQERNDGKLAAMERAFQLGESSLTDLLDLLEAVTSLDLAILDLHGRLLAAHREVEALVASSPKNIESEPSEESLP